MLCEKLKDLVEIMKIRKVKFSANGLFPIDLTVIVGVNQSIKHSCNQNLSLCLSFPDCLLNYNLSDCPNSV